MTLKKSIIRDFLKERMGHSTNLLEQMKSTHELIYFQNNDSKRIVNKTILDNGFLVVEHLYQNWNGSDWENTMKLTSSYDENNNGVEILGQQWINSNWVSYMKWITTFDENNNMI